MKSSNKTISADTEMPGQAGQGQLRAVPAGTALPPDPHSNNFCSCWGELPTLSKQKQFPGSSSCLCCPASPRGLCWGTGQCQLQVTLAQPEGQAEPPLAGAVPGRCQGSREVCLLMGAVGAAPVPGMAAACVLAQFLFKMLPEQNADVGDGTGGTNLCAPALGQSSPGHWHSPQGFGLLNKSLHWNHCSCFVAFAWAGLALPTKELHSNEIKKCHLLSLLCRGSPAYTADSLLPLAGEKGNKQLRLNSCLQGDRRTPAQPVLLPPRAVSRAGTAQGWEHCCCRINRGPSQAFGSAHVLQDSLH